MKITLGAQCQSLTGPINRKTGYSIVQRGEEFVGRRKSRGFVPPDGHWQFVKDCLELCRSGFFAQDICVKGEELIEAAQEAGIELEGVVPDVEYNAHDVRRIIKDNGV